MKYVDPDGNEIALCACCIFLGAASLIWLTGSSIANPPSFPLEPHNRLGTPGIVNGNNLLPRTKCISWNETDSLPKDGTKSGKEGYVPAPDSLPGVPDAKPAKPKTPKQGGNSGKRKRWKDSKGNIYEWDYQHGDVEKYDKRGKYKGSIDPKTGEQTKPPVKGRRLNHNEEND